MPEFFGSLLSFHGVAEPNLVGISIARRWAPSRNGGGGGRHAHARTEHHWNQGGDRRTTPAPAIQTLALRHPGNNCRRRWRWNKEVDNTSELRRGIVDHRRCRAFAQSIELCNKATGANDSHWGVINATYTRGYNMTSAPQTEQHGILPKFGNVVKPRANALSGLSSGWAREYDGCKRRPIPSRAVRDGGCWRSATRISEARAGLPDLELDQQTCRPSTSRSRSQQREGTAIRLQLSFRRVARVGLHAIQRRVHRVS